eukprot:scaffold5453_cov58-Attheya_sp.AAC.4
MSYHQGLLAEGGLLAGNLRRPPTTARRWTMGQGVSIMPIYTGTATCYTRATSEPSLPLYHPMVLKSNSYTQSY